MVFCDQIHRKYLKALYQAINSGWMTDGFERLTFCCYCGDWLFLMSFTSLSGRGQGRWQNDTRCALPCMLASRQAQGTSLSQEAEWVMSAQPQQWRVDLTHFIPLTYHLPCHTRSYKILAKTNTHSNPLSRLVPGLPKFWKRWVTLGKLGTMAPLLAPWPGGRGSIMPFSGSKLFFRTSELMGVKEGILHGMSLSHYCT